MIERVLRGIAISVALLAVVDPAVSLAGRTRPRISVVIQRGPSMALPFLPDDGRDSTSDRSSTVALSRIAVAQDVRRLLHRDLTGDFAIVDGLDPTADALVVIGDRYPEEPLPERARVSTVTLRAPIAPNMAIASATAPKAIPPATAVRINAAVDGAGMRGSTAVLIVRAGGAEAGRASHVWASDRERWDAVVDAVPIGSPPFSFDLSIAPLAAERTDLDNHATLVVEQAPRLRVLVVEGRPSWASAFLRRALEGDPRFEVSGIGQAAPRAVVRSGESPASLSELVEAGRTNGLDRFDTIVAGGLDRLSPADLSTLERFMRERGGTVALVPDARPPAGVSAALTPGLALRETLLERAAPLDAPDLPRIDASELLEVDELPADATIIARASSSRRAVVWSMPFGEGRLLFAGGMDAWRFRGESTVLFDRFWRSVLSGLALTARPAIDVVVSPSRAAIGERVQVTARVRSLERGRLGDALAIAGQSAEGPFRFWPTAESGVFTGSLIADRSRAPISVAVGERSRQTADFALRTSTSLGLDSQPRESAGLPIALLAESHGGINVTPQQVTTLERHLRDTTPTQSAITSHHPMRSAWWFIVFAASLSGEWWLRRRRGAR